MTFFQLLMLGASAFFAFKIYEHIQTLKESEDTNQEEDVRDAKTFSPFSPEALIAKADSVFEEQDFQKAFALLTEANAKEPHNPETLFKMGYMAQQLEDDSEAMALYKEALELDDANEYIHNALASLYRKSGEFTSAKIHLQASIAINDENPLTFYNYGNLLVDMQKDEEAKEMYKKAIEIDSDFAEAKEELMKLEAK